MSTSTTVRALLATALLVPGTLAAQANSGSGAEFRWSKAISGNEVRLHNITGDVTVSTHDGERVEVVGIRRGDSSDRAARVEVKEWAGGVSVCALVDEESYCDERGIRQEGRGSRNRNWRDRAYYHLEVRVPRAARVSAGSVSGDVRVTGTTTDLSATTVSGDVRIERVRAARELTATTVSGEVTAQLDAIAEGADLKLTSVSGDVDVRMPENSGVDLSMSTVSGELRSDFPLTMTGRFSNKRVSATIGRGGADMRVSTVSGDLRLGRN